MTNKHNEIQPTDEEHFASLCKSMARDISLVVYRVASPLSRSITIGELNQFLITMLTNLKTLKSLYAKAKREQGNKVITRTYIINRRQPTTTFTKL